MRNFVINWRCDVRLPLGAAVVAATLACATAAQAGLFKPATGRWCALTDVGLNDCSYDTFAQCMATLSGVGGVCSENPQAPRHAEPRPPRKRHPHHHRRRPQ